MRKRSPRARALNDRGVGKLAFFRPISRRILERSKIEQEGVFLCQKYENWLIIDKVIAICNFSATIVSGTFQGNFDLFR